jgi:hypothetical protein
MRTCLCLGTLAGILVVLAGPPSYGETLRLAVEDMTTVEDGAGNARVFFRMADPGSLGYVAISRASIQFDLAGTPRSGRLGLRVHPVAATWSPAAVAWSTDFDESVYCRTEVNLDRSGPVSLDITLLVKEILESGSTSFGFVLTTQATEATGLQMTDLSRFANLGSATVEIKCRRTPPPLALRNRSPR